MTLPATIRLLPTLSRWGLLIAMAVFVSGCEWFRPSKAADARQFSRYTEPAINSVVRVVIMPLYLDSQVGPSATVMDHNVVRSFSELNHFEILRASSQDRDQLIPGDPLRANHLSNESLRLTREEFGADAVLIGRMTHWQSFDPVAVGLILTMIDCRDGAVLWSATGTWDSGLRSTQDDIKEWYRDSRGRGNEALGGWHTVLSSPSAFTRYVSDRLAASVLSPQDARR